MNTHGQNYLFGEDIIIIYFQLSDIVRSFGSAFPPISSVLIVLLAFLNFEI